LDLFSGIGGLAIALSEWVRPVGYCENDRYAQAVLLQRMASNDIARAPIWDDVRTLRSESLPAIDFISGGFPCQDISVAGNGAGLGGERSGLYFEIERLVQETKPTFVFLENVPAIRTRGLGRVVWGLSELGYDCRWTVVSAQEIGAPHIRKRWFMLAYANGMRLRKEQWAKLSEGPRPILSDDNGAPPPLADTAASGTWENGRPSSPSWWKTEPQLGRVADVVPLRVDRLRGLGNAVVPLQAREAFKRLAGLK